jgi:Recombinase
MGYLLPDFYSGATGLSGYFTEGFSLRRLQGGHRRAIRDKIAASKRKGMCRGGTTALGYDVSDRRLVINPIEAESVRHIYPRYLELRSVRLLREILDHRGIVSKIRISRSGNRTGGKVFSRGALYELLSNPVYIGEIRHKKERHPGQHNPLWTARCGNAFSGSCAMVQPVPERAPPRRFLARWRASCSMKMDSVST